MHSLSRYVWDEHKFKQHTAKNNIYTGQIGGRINKKDVTAGSYVPSTKQVGDVANPFELTKRNKTHNNIDPK